MKIGIMSYYNSDNNYGQLLQCYAVQSILRKLGHDPYHIRYKSKPMSLTNKISFIFKGFMSGKGLSFIKYLNEYKKSKNQFKLSSHPDNRDNTRDFESFRTNYISLTPLEYSDKTLVNNPPIYDAYICGSDQIWSAPSIPYMLQFGAKKARRISMAASMGGIHVTNKYLIHLYKKYLKRFDYISLREEEGTKEIKALGRMDAETVLDPTLYISKEEYLKLATYPQKKDYVFVYLLGNKISISIDEIFGWAKEKDLDVVYVTAQGRVDEYEKIYPTINEWLGYISNAKYVITNSFHGVAFSIIFEKQFIALPLISIYARMNDRLKEVLGKFNLQSRLFSDSFEDIVNPIDYTSITLQRMKEACNFSSKIDSVLKKR